jgi:hypothetical protein
MHPLPCHDIIRDKGMLVTYHTGPSNTPCQSHMANCQPALERQLLRLPALQAASHQLLM